MNRYAVHFLSVMFLLVACTRSAADVSTPMPLIAANPPPVSTLTATLESVLIATATPACDDSQNIVKIMPLGDSITFGEGDPKRGGYRTVLSTLLAEDGYMIDFVGSQRSGEEVLADPDNEGHPGWRITNIRKAIASEGWLETYQPDIILLHIGSNDLRYGNGLYAPDNLSALLDDILARLPNVHVIVAQIIPTRWGAEVSQRIYNDAIPDIAASRGARVSVVDMREIMAKSDFVTLYHPNINGYEKMARAWESAILALNLNTGCVAP